MILVFSQEKKSSTPPPRLRNENIAAAESPSKPKIFSQSPSGDSTINTSLHMNLPGKLSILGKVSQKYLDNVCSV